jgi:hypothetical protein
MNEFNLGDNVSLVVSGEVGVIDGVAQYRDFPTQYYVEYKNSQGGADSAWFVASKINLV